MDDLIDGREAVDREGSATVLNLAAWVPATRSLGPGTRAALWLQGCPFACPGCLAPEWARRDISNPVSVSYLLQQLLAITHLTGLTLSGGEPMLQARALSCLVRLLKQERDIDVICYSGYCLEELTCESCRVEGAGVLLSCIDVLIDGPYVASLNDNRGLRGSSNQCVHFLTGRLCEHDFVSSARSVELAICGDELFSSGIPERGFCQAVDSVFCSMGYLLLGG